MSWLVLRNRGAEPPGSMLTWYEDPGRNPRAIHHNHGFELVREKTFRKIRVCGAQSCKRIVDTSKHPKS